MKWNWTGKVKKKNVEHCWSRNEYLNSLCWFLFTPALGCPKSSSMSAGISACSWPYMAVLCFLFLALMFLPKGLNTDPGQKDNTAENVPFLFFSLPPEQFPVCLVSPVLDQGKGSPLHPPHAWRHDLHWDAALSSCWAWRPAWHHLTGTVASAQELCLFDPQRSSGGPCTLA